jgi:hypothetical protein
VNPGRCTMSSLSINDQVFDGLLPVGIKLHCRKPLNLDLRSEPFFNAHGVQHSYILPPYASARAAVEALQQLGHQSGSALLDSGKVLIQVCSPARLTPARAAVLGVVFLATSDYNRRLPESLHTTHDASTNVRPIIYDYDPTSCNREFWWVAGQPRRIVSFQSLGVYGRTDVLTVQSAKEIVTINFVATLLVHHQHRGAWRLLGDQLIQQVTKVLNEAHLGAVLKVKWVADKCSQKETEEFQLCFLELLDVIASEAKSTPGVCKELSRIIEELEKGYQSCWNQFNRGQTPI